jgi:hypothetical protein
MPLPKKGKTSRAKAVERARRAKTSKAIKERLEHESYLKSQFDEDGNLLNIMETDEELLNDEQIFIVRLLKNLSEIDTRSMAIFLKTKYDKKQIKQLLDYYYSNIDSKTWADEIFSLTYKCSGFLNLNDLILDKFNSSIESATANIETTNKTKLTKEIFGDILLDCIAGLDVKNFNMHELISNVLTIYSQNQPPVCSRFGLFGGQEHDDALTPYRGKLLKILFDDGIYESGWQITIDEGAPVAKGMVVLRKGDKLMDVSVEDLIKMNPNPAELETPKPSWGERAFTVVKKTWEIFETLGQLLMLIMMLFEFLIDLLKLIGGIEKAFKKK